MMAARELVWLGASKAGYNHHSLSDEHVAAIADGCASLRTLRLGATKFHPHVSWDAMELVRAAHPKLRIDGGPDKPKRGRR